MNVGGLRRPRILAWQVVWLQLLLCDIFTLGALIFGGSLASLSAAAGGLVCVISNAVFVAYAFKSFGGTRLRAITRGFYVGQAAKLVMFAVLGGLVFAWLPVMPLIFFMGVICTQLTVFFVPSVLGA